MAFLFFFIATEKEKMCIRDRKNLKGKKAILVVGGGSMKRQGFLDKAVNYLKEGGMEVQLFEGVEPDPVSYTHLDVYKRQSVFRESIIKTVRS